MIKRPFLMLSGAFVFGEVWYYVAVLLGAAGHPAVLAGPVVVFWPAMMVYEASAAGKNGRRSGGRWLWWVLPFFVLAGMFRLAEASAWSRLAVSAMAGGGTLPAEVVCRVDEILTDGDPADHMIQFYTRAISEMTVAGGGLPDALTQQESCCSGAVVVLRTADSQAAGLRAGDMIRGKGTFAVFAAASNFGQFDFRSYYKALGLEGQIALDSWERIPGNGRWFVNGAQRLRQLLLARLSAAADAPDDAGLVSAIVTGRKSGLSAQDKKLFQESGISHIYAVSGLHASFVGRGVYRLLQKLGGSRRLCSCCACVVLCLLMLIAGNGVSVRRAFLMFVLTMAAGLAGRTYDLPVGAAAACLIILWERPLLLFQSGFQLSFCAVAGIGAVSCLSGRSGAKQADHGAAPAGKLLAGLTASLWIQLALLPAALWHFFQYPLYGVLLNLIVIPLLPVVLALGFLSAAVSCLWMDGARLCLLPVRMIFRLWRFLCRMVRCLPGALIITGRPKPAVLGIFCLFLVCFLLYSVRKKWGRKRWYPGCLMLTLALSLVFLSRGPSSGLQVTFLDVGQGDGIFLREESGYTMMIDGGSSDVKKAGENRLLPMLKASGCGQVDDWFLSHPDQDHLSGLAELLADGFPVKRLWIAGVFRTDETVGALTAAAKVNGTEIHFTHPGRLLFGAGAGFSVTCLAPEDAQIPSSANDGSMVLLAEYDGIRLLFPGDLELGGERRLMEAYGEGADGQPEALSCHILKVGHHGSKGSTGPDFLSAVNPALAVISCGRDNRYGHPHLELLSRLETQHCRTAVTAEEGAVTVWIVDGEISISCYGGSMSGDRNGVR